MPLCECRPPDARRTDPRRRRRRESEIYAIIRQLAAQGKSILIFSSELPEIVNLCDTICLLYDGSMKAMMQNGPEIDSEQILHIVTGGA